MHYFFKTQECKRTFGMDSKGNWDKYNYLRLYTSVKFSIIKK